MAISFKTNVTKRGNLKLPKFVQEMLGGELFEDLIVTVEPLCEKVCEWENDNVLVPREAFIDAGIDEENGFIIYAEHGIITIVPDDDAEDFDGE